MKESKIKFIESLGPQAKQSLKRPNNYEQLSPQRQWEIDKELGILDWDGDTNK